MRLDSPDFDINKVKGISKHTMKTELTFGMYKGESIQSVFEYDSEYIIRLYDIGAIEPDDGLLKVIHKTKMDIEIYEHERELKKFEDECWNDIFGQYPKD